MFADVFGKLLQDRAVSTYKLTKDTGLSNGMISKWCNGVQLPSAENLMKVADYFDVSVDYLLGLEDAQSGKPNVRSPSNAKDTPPGSSLEAHEAQFLRDYMSLSKQGQEHMRMSMYAAVQTFGIKKSGHIPDMEASDEIGV